MLQRPLRGVPRAILIAVITSCLIVVTVLASQGTTNLLNRLEREATQSTQPHTSVRLGGPTTDAAAHPLGPIARFPAPQQKSVIPIGTAVKVQHLGDPPAGAITPEDRDRHEDVDNHHDKDHHDVEDGDRDDSHGHHHHHHHHP